jgi:hypothetical protein
MVDVGQGKVIRQGRSRGLLVAACCGLSALFIIVAVCIEPFFVRFGEFRGMQSTAEMSARSWMSYEAPKVWKSVLT